MAVITDEFVANLPADDTEAWAVICEQFRRFSQQHKGRIGETAVNDAYLEWYAFVQTMIIARPVNATLPDPSYRPPNDVSRMTDVIDAIAANAKSSLEDRRKRALFTSARDRFPTLLPGGFAYEFLDSDYNRVQELISEMRTLVTESATITADHRRRLLNRVESLQRELHKRMSDLDTFWGLLGEAGMALGKFGKDVKPLTDRVCEILKIVTRTQARANGLPAPEDSRLLRAVNEIAEP